MLLRQGKKVAFSTIKSSFIATRNLVAIDNNTILFISFHGGSFSCNPKYIYQELLKDERFKDFNFVWALKDTSIDIPGAKVVKYNSPEYFYYLAKSKFWISNCKLPEFCAKKKNQIYINTWHGVPLKRLAHSIASSSNTFYRSKVSKAEMLRSYDIDTKRYDYLISPNNFSTEKYQECFKVSKDIIKEYGYPRNDFLVNLTENQITSLKDKFNIPKDKKVLLYCPTFRDNSFNKKGYTFNLNLDFKKWKHYLGKEYVVIFKPHYSISNSFSNDGIEDFLYITEPNTDINELYAISDVLVTDYSSTFFDYAILDRPILFYMYDLEDYRDNLRGFYLDINKDLPGQVVRYEEDLLKIIVNNMHQFDDIKQKRRAFIQKYLSSEDGNASKKVIDNLIYPNIQK